MAVVKAVSRQTMRSAIQQYTAPSLRRRFTQGTALSLDTSQSVPRVASSSIWHSLIPKAFRQPNDPVSVAEREKQKAAKSKEWNPATFFIVIAVLIGSNAIQSIGLRNERLNFTRKTEAKLALLRETIERVRRGEEVNVEKVMGTGDAEKEQEWEEVMREIERDDALWQTKKKKRDQQAQQKLQEDAPDDSIKPASSSAPSVAATDATPRAPGFY